MIVNVVSRFNCDFKTAVTFVRQPRTMEYVAQPLIVFHPIKPKRFPEVWKEGRYLAGMRLFGCIPFGEQFIVAHTVKENDKEEYIFRDNGFSDTIKTWDHWIFIRKTPRKNTIEYIDRIEIRAGVMTLFVWAFAQVFFRWRHLRWKRLIKDNFRELQ